MARSVSFLSAIPYRVTLTENPRILSRIIRMAATVSQPGHCRTASRQAFRRSEYLTANVSDLSMRSIQLESECGKHLPIDHIDGFVRGVEAVASAQTEFSWSGDADRCRTDDSPASMHRKPNFERSDDKTSQGSRVIDAPGPVNMVGDWCISQAHVLKAAIAASLTTAASSILVLSAMPSPFAAVDANHDCICDASAPTRWTDIRLVSAR